MNIQKIACLILFLTIYTSMGAQGKGNKEERLEAQKVSFITTKLDLSQSEAKVFWPIYDEYHTEQQSIRSQLRALGQEINEEQAISDQNAKKVVANILDLEEQELKLKRDFVSQLEPAIGYRKIAILFSVERQFRERVLRSIKRKMRDRRQ